MRALVAVGFLCSVLITKAALATPQYDCTSPRPEMAGLHNMVLFGVPGDQLYAYHLPLFSGSVNGTSGHVLMHVYQALWPVELDAATQKAYKLKFSKEKSEANPVPFFSVGPQGERFKVPDALCNLDFSFSAQTVFGHIEGNPDFPEPEALLSQLSTVSVEGAPVYGRRFDGTPKPNLTYIVFGTPKQYYMAHLLTDDENSFDQIVAIEIMSDELRSALENSESQLVSLPLVPENELELISELSVQQSPNNKWKLPTKPLGQVLKVTNPETSAVSEVKVVGEVYFNSNSDLKIIEESVSSDLSPHH